MMWTKLKSEVPIIPKPETIQDREFKNGILSRLEALGSTGDEIAIQLRKLGITGLTKKHTVEGNDTICPIAYYLRRQYGVANVSVAKQTIKVGNIVIKTPGVIREFTDKYDYGIYPFLIAQPMADPLKKENN